MPPFFCLYQSHSSQLKPYLKLLPYMRTTLPYLSLCLVLSLSSIHSSTANADDEMAVDQADSLNFEEFHEKDKNSINLFPDRKKEPVNFEAEADAAAGQQQSARTTYMARTRFTLQGTSTKTPFTAVTVITAQAQQMAETCPTGWIKIKNWIVPVEGDYYDHIEFACLD